MQHLALQDWIGVMRLSAGIEVDRKELLRYGRMLDERPKSLQGRSVIEFLCEALLKVRSRDGAIVKLRPNRAQREFELRRGQRNIVLKARQMGISTWVSARFFLKTVTVPGTLSVQVAHTQEAAEAIFGMAHRFLALLPEFLREGVLHTSKANTREIYFPALDSGFRVESAGDANAGRGLTITNLHCSEVARWPGDGHSVLQGLRAALIPRGELILESTPQGTGGCFWEQWQRAEETGVVRHFFPWWWETSYTCEPVSAVSLDEDERRLVLDQNLSLEQIGYRRRIRADFRGLAKQEFAEDADSCFAASGECVFDASAVDARLRTVGSAVEKRRNGALMIWLPPAVNRRYMIAVDPAGGGADGDYAVAQVVELSTGIQCAELQERLPVLELAQIVAALHQEYGDAWVVVERNNHGSGVLAHLASRVRQERIYRQSGQEGWLTSALSRPGMVAALGALLVEQPHLIQSERLLRECKSFVRLPNGRTGAQSGAHDDCVMAMAMAITVRPELNGKA